MVPVYALGAVCLEHRDAAEGGQERTRAGWALQQWAKQRLGRLRSPEPWRTVESEMRRLMQQGALAKALGIDEPIAREMHELMQEAAAWAREGARREQGP
jgi:hypothetical protein